MAQEARFSINLKPRLLEERPGTGIVAAEYFLIYHVDAWFAYEDKLGIPRVPNPLEVMVRTEINYTAPLMVGEELKIWARTTRLGRSSWTMEFQFNEADSGRAIATIIQTYVNLDLQTGRSVPLDEEFKQKVIAFEGKENVEVA
ncbi:MAG: hypothetical protein E3J65_06495 [Dehalococcoidia bacterium]|nr:MAG: hypothetical protein E3J65_06495 [Dehalococcoidia bacterium]